MGIERTVVEVCPHCDTEVELIWDVEDYGYKAYCPHCGGRLMLCDECRHGGEDGERVCACDYDSKTDSCNFNPAKETSDIDIERQLNMLHRDGYFDAELIIRSLMRKIEISDLCEDEDGTVPLVENLRASVKQYRSGETLNRKIRETEDVMEDAADVIEYLMKKADIKELELKFLKNFAQELRFDTKILALLQK